MISCHSYGQEWKSECISYYNLQLPEDVDVALYPVNDFINPREQPESNGDIKTNLYARTGITFDKTYYQAQKGNIQTQFSQFNYMNYELGVTSRSEKSINFTAYKNKVLDDKEFAIHLQQQYELRDFKMFKTPFTPKDEFERQYGYVIKNYPGAFGLYSYGWHSIYINKDERLYEFWGLVQKDTGDKSQTAEKQLRDSEPEVLSLLSRFRSRKLYEVPTEQGFCIPYGFIAGDSGNEKRNIGVTYRLKEHPDVSIFFQDFGPNPGPGNRRPDPKMSAREYVIYFWSWTYGHSFKQKELYGKGISYPEIDGRQGVAALAKFTRRGGVVDYGYMAFVKGNSENNEPDLRFFVIRDTRMANGKPPMDKDELEKIAEHIVKSIKHR